MNRIELFFILLVNLVCAVLYILGSRMYQGEGTRRDSLVRFFIMVLCPVVTPCMFLISWLLLRIVFHRKVDLEDVIFSKDRKKTYRKADEQAESNLVPLEEALAVTDQPDTRKLMLNVVRRDVSDTMGSISQALDSDDSEVSHYAASVLQGTLGDFRRRIQELWEKLNHLQVEIQQLKEKNQQTGSMEDELIQIGRKLLDESNTVLQQHILTEQEQQEYASLMDQTAEIMVHCGTLTAADLEKLCICLLEAGNIDRCRFWTDLSTKLWPEEASSYTNALRLYYATGERDAFFRKLKELEKSDVEIDHQTLEVIRFFREPENQERRPMH